MAEEKYVELALLPHLPLKNCVDVCCYGKGSEDPVCVSVASVELRTSKGITNLPTPFGQRRKFP
jgi:hypothetical protein